jgi:hypothetical protein
LSVLFGKWMNTLPTVLAAGLAGGFVTVVGGFWYYATPNYWHVGYMPTQPGLGFNHQLHAGKLGIDCRYCHTTVEHAQLAAIPPTETCMGCHDKVRDTSRALQPVRDSWATNTPVKWVRVHDLPDYVYFDHSAHIQAGVGCVSCHGRVDKMDVVVQEQPLSMGWCLDCHRNPEPHLRGKKNVTVMDDTALAEIQASEARTNLDGIAAHGVKPATDCSTCHR